MKEKIKIIKFWAIWCGPCRMIASYWDRVVHQFEDRITFEEINVDSEEAEKDILAFNIKSVPTIIMFDPSTNKEIARQPNAMSFDGTVKWIQEKLESVGQK